MVISTVSKNVCFMLHMGDKRQTMTETHSELKNCEFIHIIINLFSVLIALKIVSVANRPTIVSTCDDTVFQRVLENTGLKSEHKTNAQAKHGFA